MAGKSNIYSFFIDFQFNLQWILSRKYFVVFQNHMLQGKVLAVAFSGFSNSSSFLYICGGKYNEWTAQTLKNY